MTMRGLAGLVEEAACMFSFSQIAVRHGFAVAHLGLERGPSRWGPACRMDETKASVAGYDPGRGRHCRLERVRRFTMKCAHGIIRRCPAPATVAAAFFGALLAAGAGAQTAPSSDNGLQAFEVVRSVLQHPRCQNCHIPGNAPLQYDQGLAHTQSVMRGRDGRGAVAMRCATCHHDQNLPAIYGDRVPPGAPDWHLPPPETKMVFIGLSARDLCRVIKDLRATRGRDLPAMLAHLRDDKLVAWGWNPGGQRTLPPVTREDTVAAFKTWMDAGAPCPGP
jgi:hypothetical protein